MSLTKDKGKITRYGGGVLKILEVNDSGTPVGTSALDLGYIQETTLTDVTDVEVVTDETGDQVQTFEGNRRITLSGVLMQTHKALIDFLTTTSRGKYYQVYYRASNNIDGAVQEIFFGICKIKPQIELNSLNRRIPFEITALKNETSITITNASGTYGSAAQNATIPAGAFYVVVETSLQS